MPYFGIGMKTDLFQSCGHFWVFQICWHFECSTFTASSFRTWNSSAGIPSLALFMWCFLRPTWLHAPGCLALGEWSPHRDYLDHEGFLYCSPVYSCHLFLISSASIRSLSFLSFYWAHLCMKCSLGISNFLEAISSLSHSIVSLYFFALITEDAFLCLLAFP